MARGRRMLLIAAAAAGCLAVLPQAFAQQTFEMKLATATVKDPNEAWLHEFRSRIEAKTQGRIKARVFPAGQLGSIERVIEGMQLGTIEFSNIPPAFLVGLNPAFQVSEAPGVFASARQAQRVFTDERLRARFLGAADDKGIAGTSFWIYGTNVYATVRPVRSLEGFKGMKIGVRASKVESDLMAQLGASGVPVTFTEVLPALQSRDIDGYRGALVVLYGRQFHGVTKYVTLLDDSYIPIVGWVSKAFLAKLPADLRATLLATAQEMDAYGFEIATKAGAVSAKLWTEAGGEVIELSPSERAEALRRVSSVSTQNLSQHSHRETRELFGLMREIAAATKD